MKNLKINRNDICPCGSGEKYKRCCLKKNKTKESSLKTLSITETLELIKLALENLSISDKQIKDINVIRLELTNNKTLECDFVCVNINSIDIKVEIYSLMSAIYGVLKEDDNSMLTNLCLNYYAVKAFDKNGNELMYAISSKESVKPIGGRGSLDWMKSTIFQENTRDYRLSLAKRQISEIENGLREVIKDRLRIKYGLSWFKDAVGRDIRRSSIQMYKAKFGESIEDGDVLIDYTYLLGLKKIVINNWIDFESFFENKNDFELDLNTLNDIRREEGHNRDITAEMLTDLKIVYESILKNITKNYPNIVPYFLVDNWRIQIKKIFMDKVELPYFSTGDSENYINRFTEELANNIYLHDYLEEKEYRLKGIVVPLQKKDLHEELVLLISNYKNLYSDLIQSVKEGEDKLVSNILEEINQYKIKLDIFVEKFLLSES